MYSAFQVDGRHSASGRPETTGDGGEVKFSKGRLMRLGMLMAITMVRIFSVRSSFIGHLFLDRLRLKSYPETDVSFEDGNTI